MYLSTVRSVTSVCQFLLKNVHSPPAACSNKKRTECNTKCMVLMMKSTMCIRLIEKPGSCRTSKCTSQSTTEVKDACTDLLNQKTLLMIPGTKRIVTCLLYIRERDISHSVVNSTHSLIPPIQCMNGAWEGRVSQIPPMKVHCEQLTPPWWGRRRLAAGGICVVNNGDWVKFARIWWNTLRDSVAMAAILPSPTLFEGVFNHHEGIRMHSLNRRTCFPIQDTHYKGRSTSGILQKQYCTGSDEERRQLPSVTQTTDWKVEGARAANQSAAKRK